MKIVETIQGGDLGKNNQEDRGDRSGWGTSERITMKIAETCQMSGWGTSERIARKIVDTAHGGVSLKE